MNSTLLRRLILAYPSLVNQTYTVQMFTFGTNLPNKPKTSLSRKTSDITEVERILRWLQKSKTVNQTKVKKLNSIFFAN